MEKSIEKPIYSYFITLTYNEQNIPTYSGRLCFSKKHLQIFLDSVRHRLRSSGLKLRYFATCEYGEEGYRPHYHLIMFLYGNNHLFKGRYSFLHEVVEPLWNKGFCYQDSVSLASIMYCTSYALKDDEALERDWTGFERGRPFRLFSLRPGLGLTDNCQAWWTDYVFNDGDFRSGIHIGLPKRSVNACIPVGIKRILKDNYPDQYNLLKECNDTARKESLSSLADNFRKYGGIEYRNGKPNIDFFDSTPDKEITAFRKAVRELAKRQRKPLK